MQFPSPEHFPPFTMRDYFKSKFDYQWDMSGGWRFIVVRGSMSLNQQKLIPREQTPKQLPGNPRHALALAHKIYKTVLYLMEAGKSLLFAMDRCTGTVGAKRRLSKTTAVRRGEPRPAYNNANYTLCVTSTQLFAIQL